VLQAAIMKRTFTDVVGLCSHVFKFMV
jgi:hypothetical protein